ncbi:hypothetical protein TGARI_265420A [Toxoplasma gondii ARI]|uniref:Uncharacterized protein n=1 Tax=Toxoplasma gondii ARI TaxID=1074872 RepID=A0A139Y382_TOXGO|nr:hypothetical protein TGARI_265420A [Toxoplasma gondii ARI]
MASTTASSSGTDLSWLPSDAEEQLALGFRIVSNAYKTRVHTQEAEIRSLKAQVAEKNEQYGALQKKHSSLEVQLIESTQRGNQLAEENRQLVATIKKVRLQTHIELKASTPPQPFPPPGHAQLGL